MKCYLCNEESTSVEHSPPKCFFPKDKRLNLITVPSCDKHNHDTSLDDEYVRNLIAITKGNNEIGENVFKDKGNRSLQTSLKKHREFTQNPKHLNFIHGNEKSKNLTFQVHMERFDRVIKKIAYGLYFSKFNNTWQYKLVVVCKNFITEDYKINPIAQVINSNEQLKISIIYEGTNPEVFKFSFTDFDFKKKNHKILVMQFYEWFEVWVIPKYRSHGASIEN